MLSEINLRLMLRTKTELRSTSYAIHSSRNWRTTFYVTIKDYIQVQAEKGLIDPKITASLPNMQWWEMRRDAHLSSLRPVPSLRPLVAVVSLAARFSRNVRISGTLIPYHHKAPQHEWARHASRIVRRGCVIWRTRRWRRRRSERGAARHYWLPLALRSPPRDGRGAATRTRTLPSRLTPPSPSPTLTPISLPT